MPSSARISTPPPFGGGGEHSEPEEGVFHFTKPLLPSYRVDLGIDPYGWGGTSRFMRCHTPLSHSACVRRAVTAPPEGEPGACYFTLHANGMKISPNFSIA